MSEPGLTFFRLHLRVFTSRCLAPCSGGPSGDGLSRVGVVALVGTRVAWTTGRRRVWTRGAWRRWRRAGAILRAVRVVTGVTGSVHGLARWRGVARRCVAD